MFVNTYIQRRRIGANKHFCEQSKQGPVAGGSNIFTHKGVDKLFYTEWGGDKHFLLELMVEMIMLMVRRRRM